jgi:hypothetical protein
MAPSALEKLVSERDAVADILEFSDIQVKTNSTVPLDSTTVNTLIEELSSCRSKLTDIHTKIRALIPVDIELHKKDYHLLLQSCQSINHALHGIKANLPSSSSASTSAVPNHTDMRFPKLDLKTFDGNLLDWMPFRDMFQSSIHNNSKMSGVMKLTYLKTLLRGEAARQIQSMILTDDNYDIAWKQLQERYQNNRELLLAILRKFHNLKPVQPSAADIRSLVDVSKETIRSLEILTLQQTPTSDAMMFFVILTKLDSVSRELWEQSTTGTSIPELKALFVFLEQRARALAAGGVKEPPRKVQVNYTFPSHSSHPPHSSHPSHSSYSEPQCKNCDEFHFLYKCRKFQNANVHDREQVVNRLFLCTNCLQGGHSSSKCSSIGRCRTCNAKHHTMLHRTETKHNQKSNSSSASTSLALAHHTQAGREDSSGMLATALVHVIGNDGQAHPCRALLDNGSTSSFITESCRIQLGLPKTRMFAEVSGFAGISAGNAHGSVSLSFGPRFLSNTRYSVNALVLPKMTGHLPTSYCDTASWGHLNGLTLADPQFHTPSKIDLLLGSDIFWLFIKNGRRLGNGNTPLAIDSTLGWLVGGKSSALSQVQVHYTDCDLDKQLQAFWELESVPIKRTLTPEESKCESHFASTHVRDATGRYVVKLPLLDPQPILGHSRDTAFRRLQQLERRLAKNPSHHKEYHTFMQDYLALGHMSLVPTADVLAPKNPTYFIPHHFVLKADSTTTKFRVVFDASAKTTSGVSLNEAMMVGPTLQDNLVDIVTRFRLNPIAFTADIAKMYRQIRVSSGDADLQRILWRNSPSDPVQEFRLETVTYGTASAPYLAVKVLHQLADDESSALPRASAAALTDFYVDDFMSGSVSVPEAIALQKEMINLMNRGGLELRKWSSNSKELINSIPQELRASHHQELISDPFIKTLGIRWNTETDQFQFKFADPDPTPLSKPYTKRRVLSEMSTLFDPLGWLSPVMVQSKILMQTLWKITAGWDDTLPDEIQSIWIKFKKDLKNIDQISIPRCIIPQVPSSIDLIGFCDASEKAYGAVVYLRVHIGESRHVSIISSKTRVAPAKQISLPRLELSGALLLAELMTSVRNSIKIDFNSITAWSDSTVVLAWIKSHPSRWKTFVANRVTSIQNHLPYSCWNHVPGIENPADICSRGMNPSDLAQQSLWWNGPVWLQSISLPGSLSPVDPVDKDLIVNEEKKPKVIVNVALPVGDTLLYKFSSLSKLLRVTAWILRFAHNVKSKAIKLAKKSTPPPLSPAELQQSMNHFIKIVQQNEFATEIHHLKSNKPLSKKSRLLTLCPFLDKDGLLRVGGRLRNANIPQNQKTPVLLPRQSPLTDMLIKSLHLQYLHAGPTLLLSILQQKYWILRARDAVRFHIHKCVTCTKLAAVTQQQFMADLPSSRVIPCRAFQKCGVDYAGPFLLRPELPRSKTTIKAYLSLFVCFSTRAFHLELVSSLSTAAFLAAFRRFVSRRGRPTDVYSDCGTNFVGANRELQDMMKSIQSTLHNDEVAQSLANDGMKWHFNPPGAPHFGGLWEAGVKSVKFHLNRIIGTTRLTFEEMTTTITQVEACLNSRPLTPLSNDPSDLQALTSGHFLIGEPLVAVPEPELVSPQNRLTRWQLIQQFQQQFWKRWSGEFLTRLQQRPKWLQHRSNLQVDDLVIIKDDNLPPQKWKLGRVIILHPGADNLVRVVTLRTADGQLKRPIAKLCLLPIINTSESESDLV